MHAQAAPVAPDLEYTPIADKLPELVRPAEVEALREEYSRLYIMWENAMQSLRAERQRAEAAEAALAAMHTEHGRLYVKWENAMITLRAERQRREAAEAALAAVPWSALWRLYNDFPYENSEFAATFNEVWRWLYEQQPEVQP